AVIRMATRCRSDEPLPRAPRLPQHDRRPPPRRTSSRRVGRGRLRPTDRAGTGRDGGRRMDLNLELDYQAWMDDAVCAQVGAGPFFPERGESARAAKRICAGCPVLDQCRQYALDNNILEGVWGGTTEIDRRQLKPRPKHGPICTVDD